MLAGGGGGHTQASQAPQEKQQEGKGEQHPRLREHLVSTSEAP